MLVVHRPAGQRASTSEPSPDVEGAVTRRRAPGLEAADAPSGAGRAARWLSWVVGIAMVAAVIIVALHVSEERELVRIARRSQPWWLVVAVALQAGTYLAQGQTWRVVTQAAGIPVRRRTIYQLSLAKLFVDQAVPSGGISGTAVVAHALEVHGVTRAIVMALVVVSTVAYYAAYVTTLAVALVLAVVEHHATELVVAAALLFIAFGVAVAAATLVLAGRPRAEPRWLARIPALGSALALLGQAEPRLARDPRLIARSGLYQLAIVLLDAATMWVLVRSLGESPSPVGVFASFMLSSLWRTLGILPGGLGTFEAASVLTLKAVGVSVPAALAATLLFRGLTFWLPMIPGFIVTRAIRRSS